MLKELRQIVCDANLELVKKGVVIETWGNVSGIDRERDLIVIKPSGISYDKMTANDMVIVDLEANVIEGKWKPSSDTLTHIELYKNYSFINGVVHTHSLNATAYAQAGVEIPALGTTHADTFFGNIKCTRCLMESEMNNYELNTGKVIVETLSEQEAKETPGVIVDRHGPFTWGKSPAEAVTNSVVLEHIADMAMRTMIINRQIGEMPQYILNKHYFRKHGDSAYYGQK